MLDLAQTTRRRRMSLTPMIDVVFLLLVFFMLAARFGTPESLHLTLGTTGASDYTGPPRLVTVLPDAVLVNGIATDAPADALAPLMTSPEDTIVLRAQDGADVQRLIEVIGALKSEGLTRVVVVE